MICKYCDGTGRLGFQQETCWYCDGIGHEKVIQEKEKKIKLTDIQFVIDSFEELKPLLGALLEKFNFEKLGEQDKKELSEHFDIAIKALEKQIAKKPINQATWKACPTCEQGIGINGKTFNPMAIAYCYHCGQKLDWN
jgi:hypothetical protein